MNQVQFRRVRDKYEDVHVRLDPQVPGVLLPAHVAGTLPFWVHFGKRHARHVMATRYGIQATLYFEVGGEYAVFVPWAAVVGVMGSTGTQVPVREFGLRVIQGGRA